MTRDSHESYLPGYLPDAVAPGADPVRWSGAGIRPRGLANISCL